VELLTHVPRGTRSNVGFVLPSPDPDVATAGPSPRRDAVGGPPRRPA
jgi:hypothetical protein